MRPLPLSALRFGQAVCSALALMVCTPLLLGCRSIPKGRSAVDDVELEGAEQIDDGEVLDRLATQASPRFLGLFPGVLFRYAVFDPTQLERDRQRIRRYYQARGYYHAQVDPARVIPDGDDHVEVMFRVREGRPTKVARVTISGLDGLDAEVAEEVRAEVKLPLGEPFDEEAFVAADKRLQRALTDRGYAHARVERDAFVDIERYQAEVSYRVTTGPLAMYGAIVIKGLGELSEEHLRTALDLQTGEPYSTAALDKAADNALQLGVFNAVTVTPSLRAGIAIVPIVVKVVPGKLRSVRVGGGARLDALKSNIHGVTSWQDRNFLGDMRSFTIDAQTGVVLYPLRTNNFVAPDRPLLEGKLRGALVQRGVIEAKTKGTVELSTSAFPVLIDTDSDSNDTILGYADVSTSAGLSRTFWRISASIRQRVDVEIPFTYQGPLDDDLSTLVIAYPELDLTLDLRNSRIHPTSGAYLSNVLQVGAFGNALDVRIRPEVRGYIPLYQERLTLAARMSFGFLFPFNYGDSLQGLIDNPSGELTADQVRDLQLMYFRGFFSGGPSSNRGYPQATVSPHTFVPFLRTSAAGPAFDEECDPSVEGFDVGACTSPVGGMSLWEAALELRLRMVGPFLMAAFCDASDVAPGRVQLRFNRPHLSCGGGLRYDTAIGPIRLDVGYRIPGAQYPDEETPSSAEGDPGTVFGAPIAISFGIGQAF